MDIQAKRSMTDLSATAVLLNWKRSANLPKILTNLSQVPEVKQVVIWNNAPDKTGLAMIGKCPLPRWPKITIMGDGNNYCTLGRWLAALSHEPVGDLILLQDDDWLPMNWSEIIASWTWYPECINASLSEGHAQTMPRRTWKMSRGYTQEVLVGWGSAVSLNQVASVFQRYPELLTEKRDQLTYREADRLVSILFEREHIVLPRRGYSLPGESDNDALWQQQDHHVFVSDARTRALKALGIEYHYQGL